MAERVSVPVVRALVLAVGFAFILFARRFAQMLDPQVWDEEGIIISQTVAHGIFSFAEPINGYLLVLPRMLTFAAMLAPLRHYPRVATSLAWIVTVAILLLIALVPSRLRGRPLLAITALLVPSDAEVFGLSLYIFWWSSLLLYAAVFWEGDRRVAAWRSVAILIGGISSPAICLAVPLFFYNAIFRYRTRAELLAACLAAACAVVQIVELLRTHSGNGFIAFASIVPITEKLIGGYFVWNLMSGDARNWIALCCGFFMIAFVATASWREKQAREPMLMLAYLWLGACLLSVARVDPTIIDQALFGPRYFFLPFAMEAWILVQLLFARSTTLRSPAALLLIVAAFNALPVLSRAHADLGWTSSVDACAATPDQAIFPIPIEYDGQAASHWTLPLSGHQCRRLNRAGLIGLLER
jgi:hypothetical protein